MKRFCFSILSCLLLLPHSGRSQGIYFLQNRNIKKTLYPFSDNDKPSEHFQWQSADNTGVKVKSAVLKGSEQEQFTVSFDGQGRMLSQTSTAVNPEYTVEVDSVFKDKALIVTKKVYDKSGLAAVDSVIITDHEFKDDKVHIRFCRTVSLWYKYGRYINERNTGYNNDYYNNAPEVHLYSRFLPVDWPQTYGTPYSYCEPLSRVWKKKYKQDKLYLCKEQVEISKLSAFEHGGQHGLSKKEIQAHPFVKKYGRAVPVRFYVEAEAWTPPACSDFILVEQIQPFTRLAYSKNQYGLNDKLYEDFYPRQTDKLCVKPQDPECTFYLQGRSGIPERKTRYTFHYEYFDK